MRLYKDLVTGEVLPFDYKIEFTRKVTEYVQDGDKVEVDELGNENPVLIPVEKEVNEVRYAHNNPNHFETKEWMVGMLIKWEDAVESEEDLTFTEIKLNEEQSKRLATPEVQKLEEGWVSDANSYVESGEFPKHNTHKLRTLELSLEAQTVSDALVNTALEMNEMAESMVKSAEESHTLSEALIKAYTDSAALAERIMELEEENAKLKESVE